MWVFKQQALRQLLTSLALDDSRQFQHSLSTFLQSMAKVSEHPFKAQLSVLDPQAIFQQPLWSQRFQQVVLYLLLQLSVLDPQAIFQQPL